MPGSISCPPVFDPTEINEEPNFELKHLDIDSIYTVNEVNFFAGFQRKAEGETPPVTGAAARRLRISAKVPQSDLRDRIFYTREREKDSGVYELARTKDDFRVTLVEAPPSEQRGPFASGAYAGLAFHANSEPNEDCLYFEVGVPTDHLEEILTALKVDARLELHLSVALQSFSYEVDDALREWYHPRDLFIHGSATHAALITLRTVRGEQGLAESPDSEDEKRPHEAPISHKVLASVPPVDLRPFLGIKTALWVIAMLMLLHLLK